MSSGKGLHPRPMRLIFGLAAAHLRHEWILTLCLVIALAAVIAPLLVLLGLKEGTIETLRERLVEDPVYRELRPAQTREFNREWFEQVEQWQGVSFITPTVLPLSSVLSVEHPGQSRTELFDLIPTAAGDPLLLENGAQIPGANEVVLSAEAARRLGLQVGDTLQAQVTRSRGGRGEAAEAALQVVSVLPSRAGSLPRIYAPLEFVVDVEAFKEGYAAPARGWSGSSPEPFLSYDGAYLLLSPPLPPIQRAGLVINTGFARLAEIDESQLHATFAADLPDGWAVYDLQTIGSTVTPANFRAIEQKLRGYERVLLPYVNDIALQVSDDQSVAVTGLSLSAIDAARLGLPELPWGHFDATRLAPTRLLQMLTGPDAQLPSLFVFSGQSQLSLDLTLLPQDGLNKPIIPAELLGIIGTARQRAMTLEQERGFLMQRGGYRGFRLYAQSIDDVPGLYHQLREQGLEIIAEVEAIERIQVLDAGLNRLFWLIAVLGISGGTAVLIVSLYAAVERRRRDLGVLRLIGVSRLQVFFFPVAQGLMMAVLGIAVSYLGYGLIATVINHTFSADLATDEAFCRLPSEHIFISIIATLLVALLASLIAAYRATGIDPAEAIREQ